MPSMLACNASSCPIIPSSLALIFSSWISNQVLFGGHGLGMLFVRLELLDAVGSQDAPFPLYLVADARVQFVQHPLERVE